MKLPKVGPGFLVAAAFIGPGTVISATMAGANFGFSLLWALLFSIIATIILQEMAARLGVVTQQGLGENILHSLNHPFLKVLAVILVVSAIVVGNGAYQSGNISGASLGISGVLGPVQLELFSGISIWPLVIGLLAFALLWTGSYKMIEIALILLVALMSLTFLMTFIMSNPNWGNFFSGLLIPSLPSGSGLTIIALIGTTVVPYNLFLHAASASKKWSKPEQLTEVKNDLYISIPLGGLISIAIASTAASAFFGQQIAIQNIADLAPALQPILGEYAKVFMATGLFAAGLSSAVTAPLAAAFALSGILGLGQNLDSFKFKIIWLIILLIGVIVASSGYKPVSIIWFAQVANGILLPMISLFLLWIMNTARLGAQRNNFTQNLLGGIVIIVTLLLSGRSLMSAFGLL